MIPIQIVRVVCVVLFLLALAFAAKLMLQHEAPLAAKVGWLAAVLLVIALAPEKLPFFSRDAGTCLFFRNVFGGIFVALSLLDLFVIFWIQLPQEQVPRFDGRVVELVSLQGVVIPRVQFQDSMGKPTVFDDALAPTIFPRHTFFVGERFVVRPRPPPLPILIIPRSRAGIPLSF